MSCMFIHVNLRECHGYLLVPTWTPWSGKSQLCVLLSEGRLPHLYCKLLHQPPGGLAFHTHLSWHLWCTWWISVPHLRTRVESSTKFNTYYSDFYLVHRIQFWNTVYTSLISPYVSIIIHHYYDYQRGLNESITRTTSDPFTVIIIAGSKTSNNG